MNNAIVENDLQFLILLHKQPFFFSGENVGDNNFKIISLGGIRVVIADL